MGVAKARSNLTTRILAAALLLPLVLAAFVRGPQWFVVLFLMVCLTLSVFELSMMLLPTFKRRFAAPEKGGETLPVTGQKPPWRTYLYPGITIALGWAVLLASTSGTAEVSIGSIALASLAALLIGTFTSASIELAAARAFGILIALCYGALPWLVVWQLYLMGDGARYILLTMAVTWMGDTGGYFGGRFLGGKIFGPHPLAPRISPKKTWEGAVFGLVLSLAGALTLNQCYGGALGSTGFLTFLALIGGVAAQLGDLVESTFKRFSGVKDSGVIIPGHGGFLDRVDGILFAAPVIWAILYYFK